MEKPTNKTFVVRALATFLGAETEDSETFVNFFARGVRLVISYGAIGESSFLDVKIQAYDELSTEFIDIPGATITLTDTDAGKALLVVYPEVITDSGSTVAKQILGKKWKVVSALNDEGNVLTVGIQATYLI